VPPAWKLLPLPSPHVEPTPIVAPEVSTAQLVPETTHWAAVSLTAPDQKNVRLVALNGLKV